MPLKKQARNAIDPNFHSEQELHYDRLSLHEVVRNGDLTKLEQTLKLEEHRSHINALDDWSQTPLHYAAKANNLQACRILLDLGQADATIKDEDGAIPLHYACRKNMKGNTDAVQVIKLLAERSDLSNNTWPDNYGSTPLHTAAMRGNTVAVNILLEYCSKADFINAKDQHGCTPLHEAATYNQVAVAELLVAKGCRIFVTDRDGCTPLHLACSEGSLEIVKLLLEKCKQRSVKELIDHKDNDSTTALQYAVEARNLEIIKELISKGAHVNDRRSVKAGTGTALHLAAITGDQNIVEYLIEVGASVNATDDRNCTPLHIAAQYNSDTVINTLIRHRETDIDKRNSEGLTPLLIAAKYGCEKTCQCLLQHGATVTATDKNERGILHLAVEHNKENVVRMVLSNIRESGVDCQTIVNSMDINGLTSLHVAVQAGNVDIVHLLLEAGSDLFAKDETEETPFLQAAELGHVRIMIVLKDISEKVINDEDEFSNTSLHKAAENGHLDAVKLLVKWGAAKEARNNKYITPLDMAASNGHDDIVNFLLAEKVSPNPVDKNLLTPLHLAAKHGHAYTIECLIKGGADVTAVDTTGNTCLNIAIANGHKDAAAAILKSNSWHRALAHEGRYNNDAEPRNTPLRELFREMPDVGHIALNRCKTSESDRFGEYIEFNYDYLDDSYTDYSKLKKEINVEKLPDKSPPDNKQDYYTSDKNWIKKNHPLSILLSGQPCEELVSHQVILGLIRHKWKSIRTLYYVFLAFYASFVAMVTSYMLVSRAPYEQVTILPNDTQKSWCAKLDTEAICLSQDYRLFYQLCTYIIWCLSAIGIAVELIQVSSQWRLYFKLLNLLDWYTYISAILITLDEEGQNDCSIKKCWQWQMGAFTVFCCWFEFLLFIRRLPGLGIYVVMIVEIMKTFAKFCIVFFLFVVAFAMSFHILIGNQAPFHTPFYSISKTWVMMLGEMDYDTIFHDELLPFEKAMYAMFWLFLMLMAIIVMNLLTGLAVDDVNLLRQKARVVKLRLQVDLALDIELAMPKPYRRKTKTVVRRDRIYLQREIDTFWRMLENVQVAVEGPMLTRRAVIDAGKNLSERTRDISDLTRLQYEISKQLHEINKKLTDSLWGKTRQLQDIGSNDTTSTSGVSFRRTNTAETDDGKTLKKGQEKLYGEEKSKQSTISDERLIISLADRCVSIKSGKKTRKKAKDSESIHLISVEEDNDDTFV